MEQHSTSYIGLDIHKDSIAIAVEEPDKSRPSPPSSPECFPPNNPTNLPNPKQAS